MWIRVRRPTATPILIAKGITTATKIKTKTKTKAKAIIHYTDHFNQL